MKPLSPAEYPRVEALLRAVPINTLFARAVVERQVSGRVYVDDTVSPRTVYVAHPYGMSLLFGSTDRADFNKGLVPYLTGDVPRVGPEWLQVFPDEWSGRLAKMLRDRLTLLRPAPGATVAAVFPDARKVVQTIRVNFHFEARRYAELNDTLVLPAGCELTEDAGWIYRHMQGSVVPSAFWDTSDEFEARGAATALLYRGALASAAFASFVMDDYLELGIETYEPFRGKGFALHACAVLINYCLKRGLEPVWACRLDNHASYRLALRLGFVHALSIPYYQLPR